MSLSFKIWYKYEDDYDPVFVNGAIGQLNQTGEAVLHFFSERDPLPREVHVDVSELGNDVRTTPADLDYGRIRMVKSGLIMNIDQLKDLREVIDKIVEESES